MIEQTRFIQGIWFAGLHLITLLPQLPYYLITQSSPKFRQPLGIRQNDGHQIHAGHSSQSTLNA